MAGRTAVLDFASLLANTADCDIVLRVSQHGAAGPETEVALHSVLLRAASDKWRAQLTGSWTPAAPTPELLARFLRCKGCYAVVLPPGVPVDTVTALKHAIYMQQLPPLDWRGAVSLLVLAERELVTGVVELCVQRLQELRDADLPAEEACARAQLACALLSHMPAATGWVQHCVQAAASAITTKEHMLSFGASLLTQLQPSSELAMLFIAGAWPVLLACGEELLASFRDLICSQATIELVSGMWRVIDELDDDLDVDIRQEEWLEDLARDMVPTAFGTAQHCVENHEARQRLLQAIAAGGWEWTAWDTIMPAKPGVSHVRLVAHARCIFPSTLDRILCSDVFPSLTVNELRGLLRHTSEGSSPHSLLTSLISHKQLVENQQQQLADQAQQIQSQQRQLADQQQQINDLQRPCKRRRRGA